MDMLTDSALYLFHHIFLPPKLPQEDDYNPEYELILLDEVIKALRGLCAMEPPKKSEAFASVGEMIGRLRNVCDMDGNVSAHALESVLADLDEDGTVLPIYIRRQNAAVLMTRRDAAIEVEAFELSPRNQAVYMTPGRLRRQFPGPTFALDKATFQTPGFRETVAQTLAKMSHQNVAGTKAKVRKARHQHDEDRDTTDPVLITEFFTAFLRPRCEVIHGQQINKNTREEVLWLKSRSPWRRSALWLFVRATIQLVLRKTYAGEGRSEDLFKHFMIYFLSTILSCCSKVISHEQCHIMTAKIGRRLRKLEISYSPSWLPYVQNVLHKTHAAKQGAWDRIIWGDHGQNNLHVRDLDFNNDIEFSFPQLDQWLEGIEKRKHCRAETNVLLQLQLQRFEALNLPLQLDVSDPDTRYYNLAAFEGWVEFNLDNWIQQHLDGENVCQNIGRLIETYHDAVTRLCPKNPEAISVMLLTILELWIACDRSAVHICPALRDYDPCIPIQLWQSLLMPRYSQMKRLMEAEEYLRLRHLRVRYPGCGIFRDYGTLQSFSVRFFDRSDEHRHLMASINERARKDREMKKVELAQKQQKYRELYALYSRAVCTYNEVVVDRMFDIRERQHSNSCQRCKYKHQADSIHIHVHEWPLPGGDLEAKSAVFELRPPRPFVFWRDTSVFVLSNVLKAKYEVERKPRAEYRLETYSCLSAFLSTPVAGQRIRLLSEDKPHTGTHRKKKHVIDVTEKDVCLANGMNFRYFDNTRRCFTSNFEATHYIPTACMYNLPQTSRFLQKFLFRPADQSNGPPPNTVIASQDICPEGMSLGEYKALCSMTFGVNIQWQNILRQLVVPVVVFKKVETCIFVLQIIHQAGPLVQGTMLRAGHVILEKTAFTNALLVQIKKSADVIKENWECAVELNILILLSLRVLSLSGSAEVQNLCLSHLKYLRGIAFEWVLIVGQRASKAETDKHCNELLGRGAFFALICITSFDCEGTHLEQMLEPEMDASIFIQCCMVIHDKKQLLHGMADDLVPSLYYRWQMLTYRCQRILIDSIVRRKRLMLDQAIQRNWAAYRTRSLWSVAPGGNQSWLVSQMSLEKATDSGMTLHYNTLTGSLLINGLPLARLPSDFERHPSYRTLFEQSLVEVMPSNLLGMQFSGQREHFGHTIHLAKEPLPESGKFDLNVRAVKDERTWDFVPPRILRGYKLPDSFVEDYAHWYDFSGGFVEFRPKEAPWRSSSHLWRLQRIGRGGRWCLVEGDISLVNLESRTAKVLGDILQPIEMLSKIHLRLNLQSSLLDIEVPRLRLSFTLPSGHSAIQSRQYPGMVIDAEQSLGTLLGLRSRLLLVNPDNCERKVIIPEGDVVWERAGAHLAIDIVWQAAANKHVFSVNTQLGCLIDNGSLQSKLFLCYLHAVTSFCAPDPLTQRTGTEQALTILHSASLRSFRQLQPEDTAILLKLAALTPVRRYYPANERVMQSVCWERSLSCLAQHEDFREQVNAIFSQNQRQNMFYPEHQWKQPTLPAVDQELLHRSRIRSATFRVSNFGAEDHTTAHDCAYVDLSRNYESDRSSAVFTLCKVIYDELPPTLTTTHDMLRKRLWKFLSTHGEVNGPNTPINRTIGYDATWLQESGEFISTHWCSIHQLLRMVGDRPNKFQLMIWLSTLAFTQRIQEAVLEVLAAIYVAPTKFSEMPPPHLFFHLSAGHGAKEVVLRNHVQTYMRTVTPESSISAGRGEIPKHFRSRIQQLKKDRRNRALTHFISDLCSQWPVRNPSTPTSTHSPRFNDYYEEGAAMVEIRNLFLDWYKNWELERYISQVASVFASLPLQSLAIPSCSMPLPAERSVSKPGYVDVDDILDSSLGPPPDLRDMPRLSDFLRNTSETRVSTSALSALVNTLGSEAKSSYEREYLEQLRDSLVSLKGLKQPSYISVDDSELERVLSEHLLCCEKHYETVYDSIRSRMTFSALDFDISNPKVQSCRAVLQILASIKLWPRFSPDLLLRQLTRKRWPRLSEGWKRCLIAYGLSITTLQRAKRLIFLVHQHEDLIRETQNPGHTNWNPYDFPESLLIEIENNLLIREVQERIAAQMRNVSAAKNVVMQLNMGEGKSSVIVPIVVVARADGSCLIRVIVAKPQSRQMFQMLVAKLGGLLGRRVYHLPISRSVRISEPEALEIERTCMECMKEGGVLLVQPEHILSLKLMCLEYLNIGEDEVGRCLLRVLEFLKTSSCDIVDESDENFSVRFELIYTMGTQRPLEFSPQRWLLIQQLLTVVRKYATVVKGRLPHSIEVIENQPGSFPRIRLLGPDAGRELVNLVAEEICTNGIDMLPLTRQPGAVREAIRKYVLSPDLSAQEIQAIERSPNFWSPATHDALLLLRGLLAGNVMAFCFGHKRWRVNYGSDLSRRPPTRLSVPFRAKDSPAPRAEFSHPDVVIILTLLNHYHAGLSNEDLFLAFSHLEDSDQADSEYQMWVDDAPSLPHAYHQLSGVNLQDQHHCTEHVFPALRFSKGAIDYFLAYIAFPKELKEFPLKLSASGWDIGEIKGHPTVGFSGTNDSRVTLPLEVSQLDLPEQSHTNALVLNLLLGPKNSVAYYPVHDQYPRSDAQILLAMVVGLDPPIKVILDVGAQILERNNLEVAQDWLDMTPKNGQNQAVVFVNEGDEICVVDRTGLIEPLQVSPFANHLESCLVFLDEAHTRGIDLRLPKDYRAAVTLGAGITKDKLVQACMRMRKLGHGQSVAFCIPEEIKTKILALPGQAGSCDINVSSVLHWAISETWAEMKRIIPLWATQGVRFERHSKLWQNIRHRDQASVSKSEAEGFLESESQSLKQRYQPQREHASALTPYPEDEDNVNMRRILDRCREVGSIDISSTQLEEEQERELAPEIEQERQIQRPPPTQPESHHLHPDLRQFVLTGSLKKPSGAFVSAFETLRNTSAAIYLNVSQFPPELLVTTDFAKTIQTSQRSPVYDNYLRPVQWVLTSSIDGPSNKKVAKHVIIISPFEANELFSDIQTSRAVVLHLYSPRQNRTFPALDKLDLYNTPVTNVELPMSCKIQLNLFAGQLYISSYDEYVAICAFLGVAAAGVPEDQAIAADGFIVASEGLSGTTFTQSPLKFLGMLMSQFRKEGQKIDKTHVGKILDGKAISKDEFQVEDDNRSIVDDIL